MLHTLPTVPQTMSGTKETHDTHNEAKTKERASAEWTRGEGHEAAGMTMTEQGDVRNRGHQKHRQAQGSWKEDKD